jgi:histidinol dehydrogenase
MLAIPAALAECPTVVLCSPPSKNGKIDAGVLFVAKEYGIRKIFKLGGAQAIAAMAYGTQTVSKVNKIFGPGNKWVAAAKAHVSRDPSGAAQDLPAGPSELMVIADGKANPAFVAADLLSQAEHDPDSQVILVTNSEGLADSVASQIIHQKVKLARQAIIEEVLSHSYILTVTNLETAIDIANRYAPEHLILQIRDPRKLLDQITTAGSVFLGPWAPETVGDYCSGTNHVLPTYGLARSYSGLGVNDFVRTMTVQELNRDGIAAVGPLAETLAKLEGLEAHGAAVAQRLKVLNEMEA